MKKTNIVYGLYKTLTVNENNNCQDMKNDFNLYIDPINIDKQKNKQKKKKFFS